MMIGDFISIVGKSSKGKNRIHEHGTSWKVVQVCESVICCENRPSVLLESTQTNYQRWMSLSKDRDFAISESPEIRK